ncbi:TPA: glutaredoxin-like protein NrdH [Streptococcus pneumoniae]|nr:glutaredoxin-like protein NrdH [Streptococcus pneumoniae]
MVTVYSKNNCVQCKMTKRFLDSNNVSYREINLDEQPEYVDQIKELGFSAAPVIQTPTEVFSGFQPGKLKQLA